MCIVLYISKVHIVVFLCLKRWKNCFCQKNNVLTLVELQERYAETCKRLCRSNIAIKPEYLLIEKKEPYQRKKPQEPGNKEDDNGVETDAKKDMSFHCPSISTHKKRKEMK